MKFQSLYNITRRRSLRSRMVNDKRLFRKLRRQQLQAATEDILRPFNVRIKPKKTRNRSRTGREPDWEYSIWSNLLKNETFRDPTHRNGKLFRLRFRVPYPIFNEIVEDLKSRDEFKKQNFDCCKQRSIPIELLVLGTLRILGRGMCLDGINELSKNIDGSHEDLFPQVL